MDRTDEELFFLETLLPKDTPEETPPLPATPLPSKLSLAMAYVPMQTFGNLYDAENAFARGSLFQNLEFPFAGDRPKGVRCT